MERVEQRFQPNSGKVKASIPESLLKPLEGAVFIIQAGVGDGKVPAVRRLVRKLFFELFDHRLCIIHPAELAVNISQLRERGI